VTISGDSKQPGLAVGAFSEPVKVPESLVKRFLRQVFRVALIATEVQGEAIHGLQVRESYLLEGRIFLRLAGRLHLHSSSRKAEKASQMS
jgi:hypothetical protein